jgi:hypothetical protein
MRRSGWLVVAGLALVGLGVVLVVTPTSLECGSLSTPTSAKDLRFPFPSICRFEHNERLPLALLAAGPGLVIAAGGLVLRRSQVRMGAGGFALLLGLVGLAIAMVLSLVPVQPDCGTMFNPTTRAEFQAKQGGPGPVTGIYYTCQPELTHRLTSTLMFAAPAGVLTVGGWLLHRAQAKMRPEAPRGGHGPIVAGLAFLAVAAALMVTPLSPMCGSVLGPSPASACLHHMRWAFLLMGAGCGLVLVVGGLVVRSRRTTLGASGWVLLVGAAGLAMALALAVTPSSPDCGSLANPTSKAEWLARYKSGWAGACPVVNATRRTAVLVVAVPAAVTSLGGLVLRKRRTQPS